MKKQLFVWASGILMVACSTAPQGEIKEGHIDIIPAFENLTELKVSHLGKNIRYVPLETTDSSLVIDYACKLKLSGDKLIVSYRMKMIMHCFLFDAKTGKFIREIGHRGEDASGYSEPKNYVHPVTGNIYFHRQPNKLVKYNQEGEFLGEVLMPNGLSSGFYPLLTQNGMLVYEEEPFNPQYTKALYYLDEVKGKMGDVALHRMQNNDGYNMKKMHRFHLFGSAATTHGLLNYTGLTKIEYKDDTQAISTPNYPAVWSVEDEFHFHEPLGDTIFQVKGLKLEPYRIFDLGERRLPAEDRGKREGNEDKLTMAYVLETPELIFFQCAQDLYNEVTMYNGLYRKSDETLMMGPTEKGFTDDLTGFLPFHPKAKTLDGGFMGILRVEDIQEWIEEHPDVKLEGALAPLKGLADDANPVVVIVEP